MDYNVIYNNRKAILTGFFDSKCLLFDMKDGKPDFIGFKIIENYPDGYYCVFFSQIPIEERMKIVKCKTCGKVYRVNKNSGYRTSFFKWAVSQDNN